MVVQKAIFLLFFVSKVNILLGNPFPQNYETDEYGDIQYDDLGNPILLEEVNNFEDILDPGQCILPAELQSDGNLPCVSFSSCQRNLIKTSQIEDMIALITKMDLIFS